MSNILKGLNEGRGYSRDSWDSNMPGYQGDYGGAENFGRRNREWDEDDRIDARIRAEYEQKKQYEQNGKFWLKLKDSQRHLPAGPFAGKQAANTAAIELLKQQPELKGNLLITAYGPDETQAVAEAELDEAKAKKTEEDIFLKGKKVGSITTTTTKGGITFYTAQVGNSYVAGSDTREEALKHLKRLYRDYYSKQGVAEAEIDRPGMKDGRPYSDPYRRHPGNSSYMTPAYMLDQYKKRLAQIAAGPYKRPKEVAQLQSRIAKLEKQGVAEEQLDELSNKTLASYKKKAGADATQADKRGDYARGNKRMSGIMKATKKEFDNDAKSVNEEELDENLNKWFKEKWVRFGPDGKIRGDCARGDDSEGKPKCLPQSKAQNLGKKGRASAASRKRREDPNPERSGKAINVNTKKKSNEGVAEEQLDELSCWSGYTRVQGVPAGAPGSCKKKTNEEQEHKCPHCGGEMVSEELMNEKKDACYYKVKSRYKVWPSAYASGALVKCRKSGADSWGNGGKKNESIEEGSEEQWTVTVGSKTGGTSHTMTFAGTKEQAIKKAVARFGTSKNPVVKAVPAKQSVAEEQLDEKWTKKYKDSINCSNPKGFSQKAHCAGKQKNESAIMKGLK